MGQLRRIWLPGMAALAVVALAWRLGSAAGDQAGDLPVLWTTPAFQLLDQSGTPFSSAELSGRPWVASFVFTHCKDVCPLITARMAELRDSLRSAALLGTRAQLASFSVDPARDTPAVLENYASAFGGPEPSDWVFLTGSEPDSVRQMIQEGFHLTAVALPPEGGAEGDQYDVMHSPRLLLVDGEGRVRGLYDPRDPEGIRQILRDLRLLVE